MAGDLDGRFVVDESFMQTGFLEMQENVVLCYQCLPVRLKGNGALEFVLQIRWLRICSIRSLDKKDSSHCMRLIRNSYLGNENCGVKDGLDEKYKFMLHCTYCRSS